MAVQQRALLLSATALTFFTSRFAPACAVSQYLVLNILAWFFAVSTIRLGWNILVYPFFFSPLRHLPQPPDSNFILGHFRKIFKEPTGDPQRGWIDEVPNDGVIYYRWMFNEPRILVTNPKALAEVLVQRNYDFIKPRRLRNGLGRLLGIGILLAEGDEHKRQRRALMPAFSFRHVKDLYPVFWNKSIEMTDAMAADIKANPDASSIVEIRDWASRSTLDIIGVAGMGQDFNAIASTESELYKTYSVVFGAPRVSQIVQLLLSMLPFWLLKLLPIKQNTEIADAIGVIKKTAANLIKEKRANLEKGGLSDVDILSVALGSGGFSDEDLVNQLMTFLAAGHETTASAVAWCVYLLCKHPETQSKLRDELQTHLSALASSDATITSTEIDKLPYLNAILNESLRLFPPVPLTLRETEHDTTIQGHFIPKGVTVILCPWAVNTSKHMWGDDAREFKPERWMGPGHANTGGAESNFATTTFLHGPRSCIGKDFAKAEFACLIAALVGKFEMQFADPDQKLEIQGGITARPKGGLRIKLKEV